MDHRKIHSGVVDRTSPSSAPISPPPSYRGTAALAPLPSRQVTQFLSNRRAVHRIVGVGAVLVVLSAAFLIALWGGRLTAALTIQFFANIAALAFGCMITHRILMGSIRYRAEKTYDRAVEAIQAMLYESR